MATQRAYHLAQWGLVVSATDLQDLEGSEEEVVGFEVGLTVAEGEVDSAEVEVASRIVADMAAAAEEEVLASEEALEAQTVVDLVVLMVPLHPTRPLDQAGEEASAADTVDDQGLLDLLNVLALHLVGMGHATVAVLHTMTEMEVTVEAAVETIHHATIQGLGVAVTWSR